MTLPSLRLFALAAVAAVVSTLAGIWDKSDIVAQLALLLAVPVVIDWMLLLRTGIPVVVGPTFLQGFVRRPLRLGMQVLGARVVAVAPDWPDALGGPVPNRQLRCRHSPFYVEWQATPRRRGLWCFGPVWIFTASPMKLWLRRHIIDAPCRASILPDPSASDACALDPLEGRLEGGRLLARGELNCLRPFQNGDEWRHIDWKATARRAAPVVREWLPEVSRSVTVAIDAGRLMLAEHGGESKLDAALRALGRLAAAAEIRGDAVAAVVWANRVLRQVSALSGPGQAARLLRHVGDIMPQSIDSDFCAVVPCLLRKAPRSLLVVITDVVDATDASALLPHLLKLARQQVLLLVLLRDPHIDVALATDVEDANTAYRRAAAELCARERAVAVARLRASKLQVLDVSMHAVAAVLERVFFTH